MLLPHDGHVKIRRALSCAAVAFAGVATSLACGASSESTVGVYSPEDAGSSDAASPQPMTRDAGAIATASGVVILHAAAFPAFRLCFENYPDLPPQPDRTVMPQANVVGVEVGSVVRISPLEKAPGKVYVINQRKVLAGPDDVAKPCGQTLREFIPDIEFHVAGQLDEPIGASRVTLLAITGCGSGAYINALGVPKEDCGPEWNETSGSLRARTLTLLPTSVATETSLPVQVVHMAPLLEAKRQPGEAIEVSFGALDAGPGALAQNVVTTPPLFDASPPVTLKLDQTKETTYGTHGFRIAVQSNGADASAAFSVEQSLADIQDLSFSQTVPTSYYMEASNYALILLGDPRVQPTYPDGGPNPDYARRSVHLLAVPVKAPTDAGAPPLGDR